MTNTLLQELPEEIRDWASLAEALDLFHRAEAKQEWVFRGLSDGSDHLETTLEQVAAEFDVTGDKIPDLEVKLITEFMRCYHLYAVEPPPTKGDTLDWLALMRHHGAPSRLLDFTFSLPVAAYFALERAPRRTPRVWAVNKSWLTHTRDEMIADLDESLKSEFKCYEQFRNGNAFRKFFLVGRPLFVSPVGPFRLNQRYTIQQGCFLCPGDVTQTFENNLKAMSGYEENVRSIPIAKKSRSELLTSLLRTNISRATLFPGLDGFSVSLWTRVASLKRLQSMEDSDARSKVNLDLEALGEW